MSQVATADGTGVRRERVSPVRLLTRVLGVCFFSVVSIAIAFYAFSALPQVQDLFFDARPYAWQGVVYWAGFYFVGIFFWGLPLVFTARLLLLQNFDRIGIDTEERFRFYILRFPGFFVVLAFATVLIGVYDAASNLPTPTLDGGNAAEKVLRPYLERHLIVLLVASAGVLVLVAIRGLFLANYGKSAARLEDENPSAFQSALSRFERIARRNSGAIRDGDRYLLDLKPAFLTPETWIEAQRVKVFMWRYLSRLTTVLLALIAIHFLSYSDFLQNLLTWPSFVDGSGLADWLRAIADAIWIKRATFLFILFGGWLPFLTIMALLSNRFQFPFITLTIAVAITLTLFISDGHDVRVVRIPEAERSQLQPVGFAGAVTKWKEASGWSAKGCGDAGLDAEKRASCPRPIVVAGEGGGSRAAFLIASVLGSMEDESLKQTRTNPEARPFHSQLFAISSVSGSSVGAAFFTSALKRQPAAALEDLKRALYKQRLWFLNVANAGTPHANFLNDAVTYKDALQAALSNDFLSPPMIAYLARDVLTLSRFPYILDRAGVLETSWEDAFDGIYGDARLKSPMSAPLQAVDAPGKEWTPLLFLNATSVETGRRTIVTPVKINERLPNGQPLFIDTYDTHELFCAGKPVSQLSFLDRVARFLPQYFSPVTGASKDCVDGKPRSIDVRLSTAASISSRSPFVSPHANIRDSSSQISDSLVDGGYFDNSGSVTAVEIAAGLKAVDPLLEPYIVQVSSEPEWFANSRDCGTFSGIEGKPVLPDQADFNPLGTLADVLTLNATRVARGYETLLQAPRQFAALNGGVKSDAGVFVCPQPRESFILNKFEALLGQGSDREAMRVENVRRTTQRRAILGWKTVSLSWWLSPPLQAYLDGQIYSKRNLASQSCVMTLLRNRKADERARCG